VLKDAGMWVSVNIAHYLLGPRNKDSMRKTAKELGWVLMCSMMKACKHCLKLNAKQKNV
jgi:hypothetical protein